MPYLDQSWSTLPFSILLLHSLRLIQHRVSNKRQGKWQNTKKGYQIKLRKCYRYLQRWETEQTIEAVKWSFVVHKITYFSIWSKMLTNSTWLSKRLKNWGHFEGRKFPPMDCKLDRLLTVRKMYKIKFYFLNFKITIASLYTLPCLPPILTMYLTLTLSFKFIASGLFFCNCYFDEH